MNKSEEFVYRLCQRSFLSLWSFANPLGKEKKELCDILVVCAPDIIIFSVKEIKVTNSGNVSVDWDRWNRKAIEASADQIYGAERWIRSATHVVRSDGNIGLAFPRGSECRIHRVAVALGGQGNVPIKFGDLGKGFIHAFDEVSFGIVAGELDTITDFVMYLKDKESFLSSSENLAYLGTEEDLLALYLGNGRAFPSGFDLVVSDGTPWEGFAASQEYRSKKIADKDSYRWDELIETAIQDILHGRTEAGISLMDIEIAVRTMAKENRFSRRILGRSLREFLVAGYRARMVLAPSNVVYVFVLFVPDEDAEFRTAYLGMRAFVARGLNTGSNEVVSTGIGRQDPGKGSTLDLAYLKKTEWTSRDQAELELLQKEFGFFANSLRTEISEDEYPHT